MGYIMWYCNNLKYSLTSWNVLGMCINYQVYFLSKKVKYILKKRLAGARLQVLLVSDKYVKKIRLFYFFE
jgi:hypothetical protein